MSKKIDITTKDEAELTKQLGAFREELRTARFALGAEGKNTKAKRTLRRNIARILTESGKRTRQGA